MALLEDEPEERAVSFELAAARHAALVDHLSAAVDGEAEGRAVIVRMVREEYRTLRNLSHAGAEAAGFREMLQSVASLEAAVRATLDSEYTEVTAALSSEEFAARAVVQERLIRGGSVGRIATSSKVVRMRVVADRALVRAGYAKDSKKVANIAKGEIFHIIERKGNRAKLREHNGWVSVVSMV